MAGAQTQTFTYFVGRESVQVTALPGMASWREHLYALMERNATDPAFYFRLPTHQVFELGIIVELWPPMPGLPREASTTSCPTLITPFDRTQARQWVSHILQRSTCCSAGHTRQIVRARMRQDLGEYFVGVVRAGGGDLRWRRIWSMRSRRVRWDRIRSCTVERDRRPGVARHTIRLALEHEDGLLEVMLRGPWGAIALAELRDRIRTAAHLSIAGSR